MMPYDVNDRSTVFSNIEMEEDIPSYPMYGSHQHNFYTSTISNSNRTEASDAWQSSIINSNSNYDSFYFPSPVDYNNFDSYGHVTSNNHSSDQSRMCLNDSNSYTFSNNYPMYPYSTPADSYKNLHQMSNNSSPILPPTTSSIDIQLNQQSTFSSWDSNAINMRVHDDVSTTNSNKQPCFVCHDESSGYHFGAYTCEPCKAFYRRVTKDSNIEIQHSCEVPLPNITKLNRKDCRACRKAKCDRVGMTMISKDRVSKTKPLFKSSSIPIKNLLEQLAHDLTNTQLSTSSTLEHLLDLLDLPSTIPSHFDHHSLYINARHIWRHQVNHSLELPTDISLNDIFAVLLFLFYLSMITKESNENHSTLHIQFDKLINSLQEEIHRIIGIDHRLAIRINALFMKCYVTLVQYHSNSTNLSNSNHNTQSIHSYQ